jgi:hypothetical protein
MLNEISRWFESIGVHSVLGGASAGALLVLALRALMARRDPGDATTSGRPSRSAASVVLNNAVLNVGKASIHIKRNVEDGVLPDKVSAEIFQPKNRSYPIPFA